MLEVAHGVVEFEHVVLLVRKAAESTVKHIVGRLLHQSDPTLHDAELGQRLSDVFVVEAYAENLPRAQLSLVLLPKKVLNLKDSCARSCGGNEQFGLDDLLGRQHEHYISEDV